MVRKPFTGEGLMTPRSLRRTRARLRDVAEAAGVDVSVVSRVLNGDPQLSVRRETRERIVDAARRLDYRPNAAARSLKTARTMALGLLIPDLFNVAYAAIARGAHERTLSSGYILVVATGPASECARMLEGRVDGLMIATATTGSLLPNDLENRLPVLLVNRREPGDILSVTVQDERGAALATEYLLSLGHRRIAHVAGPQNTDTGRRRQLGYLGKMRERGVQVPRAWLAEGSFTEAGGYAAATRLLAGDQRPTALFVTNLTATIGAMAAARRLGLRIPDDVSIVGFDDVELASYLDPPLTTIRMPLEEMGGQAVATLLALINGEPADDVIVDIPPQLVVRASAAPPLASVS